MTEKIAVIGLGYVGLPVALAFARKLPGTVGFDINQADRLYRTKNYGLYRGPRTSLSPESSIS